MNKSIKLLVFSLFFLSYPAIPGLFAQQAGLPFVNPGQSISMDFQDASLKDVLKIFSIQSGLSFIASENVQNKKITLYLDKVSVKDAMDKLFLANSLVYTLDSDSNIFIVKDTGITDEPRITKVYYLKYHSVSSSAILKENAGSSAGGSGATANIIGAIKGILSKVGIISEDSRTNSLIITDIPSAFPEIEKLISYLDISQPQIMLEVEMLDVAKGTTDKIGIDWTNAGSYAVDIKSAAQTTSFPYNTLWASSLFDVANTITKGNLTFPTNLKVILNFLNTQTDTKYLARPKILTMNNEVAEIKIVTQEVVGEKRRTEGAGTSGVTTAEAERYETGVTLRVTPQINPETNEITMYVVPSVSEATKASFVGLNDAIYYNPEVRTSKSLIRVKDGETIVVGGLIKNKSTATNVKLPILGNIPILGMLFRSKTVDPSQERELLVFITPRIVKDRKINLTQEKKINIQNREQGVFSMSQRDMNIDVAMNNLDKKNK